MKTLINKLKADLKSTVDDALIVRSVKCNICGWRGAEFSDFDCGFGHIYKKSACPSCKSHPRHRAFHFFLKKVLPKKKHLKLLHFAPEKFLTSFIMKYQNIEYLSVDVNEKVAMRKEDITSLTFDDSAFDVIFCSHVLEHVEDDKSAMRELYRVLKKGGFAIIDVPIDRKREQTYEDQSIISHEERTKEFWQFNHVRLYGKDFPDKLRCAGFTVTDYDLSASLGMRKAKYYGLPGDLIYYCTKEEGCRRTFGSNNVE